MLAGVSVHGKKGGISAKQEMDNADKSCISISLSATERFGEGGGGDINGIINNLAFYLKAATCACSVERATNDQQWYTG